MFVGYTNASWTLKIDLTNEYISRILKYLENRNYSALQVKVNEDTLDPIPLLNLNSNYIHRSANILPKQGNKSTLATISKLYFRLQITSYR